MTTPPDPFAAPGGEPPVQPPYYGQQPAYGQPPAYSQPVYGQPPAYGQPPVYGQPAYSQPVYGQPVYGRPAYGAGSAWPLASWGQRVGATVIDMLLVLAIYVVAGILAFAVGQASNALSTLVFSLGYLAALCFTFWQLTVQGQTGQTIGKKQLGIRVLKEQDGQLLGAGLSIGRYFVHFLDAMACGIGYLWPLWDAKKQTFADKLLTTVVVKG